MTPMDELRRLLDERGVKYDKGATVINGIVATFWHDRDGYPCSAIEGADDIPDGEVSFQACVTPTQAIAATLENAGLQAENAKLREQYEAVIADYRSEVAKLRKLCADLRFCRRNNCLKCSHGRFCDMRFDERFAELGIEVDG